MAKLLLCTFGLTFFDHWLEYDIFVLFFNDLFRQNISIN